MTFEGCIEAVADEVRSLPKGLELFRTEYGDDPFDGYSLAVEVDGVVRAMDRLGIENAHVVGYSGGGGVAMALAMEHPHRVRTLALDEPVIGLHLGVPDEEQFWADLDAALDQQGVAATLGVVEATNAPGARPPEFADPPPPWLRSRITRTPILARAARDHYVAHDDLGRLRCPVHVAYGSETRAVTPAGPTRSSQQ